MQVVTTAWTETEISPIRRITQGLSVSWKKDFKSSIRPFTIGVSLIGGNDFITGNNVPPENAWNKYVYSDESSNLMSIQVERGLSIPLGGLTKAMADIRLDNTSGRYTPRYAGGHSEIFTAIQPRRPIIINEGFNIGGVDQMIPAFVGVTEKQVKIDTKSKSADLHAVDFVGFLQNQAVDKTAMFTSQRTDIVIANLLSQAGFATSQYDLDEGVNIVKFGLFNQGDKFANLIDELVKAEYGQFYQDEAGVLRFENRQHWSFYPHTDVQRIITTAQVINAVVPTTDHIINVVEVKASPREVKPTQIIWQATNYGGSGVIVLSTGNTEVWASYNDPIFQVDTPVHNGTPDQTSFFIANTKTDGTGIDVTSSVTLKHIDNFAQTSKMVFTNNYGSEIYITTLDIWGRAARLTGDIYYKGKAGASITAYEEQPIKIENKYIQDPSWAQGYAELILRDFSTPQSLIELNIRAIPELTMGDLISWQGRQYFIWDIKSQLDPGGGFIQDLKLLARTIRSSFRIGISIIGGTDEISA